LLCSFVPFEVNNGKLCAVGWGDLNFGRCLFISASKSICGPMERGLCDFCLCLSTGVDERRAVLLPVLLPFYCGTIFVARVCYSLLLIVE
jgi:hypothetical protein